MTAAARALGIFLRRTLAMGPVGTEGRHLDMEAAVHHILRNPGESLR